MYTTYKDITINYEYYENDSKTNLIYLHGWGQNIEMMKMVGDKLQKRSRVIIVDLPGFGLSSEPDSIWTMYDYTECIHDLLKSLKVSNPIMIGHSFGGKISLIYASKYKTQKLVLFGSPFKKEIQKLNIKTKILKSLKKVPLLNKLEGFAKKHIGSRDYKQASEFMRKILVEHVNLDITEDVKKIKCPTLIVWGTMDQEVPIERAYELEKLISDSAVIPYEGCSHYAYLERLNQTVNILKNFIEGE